MVAYAQAHPGPLWLRKPGPRSPRVPCPVKVLSAWSLPARSTCVCSSAARSGEQLADGGILRTLRRAFIAPACFRFRRRNLGPNLLEAARRIQPDRFAPDKPKHVLTPNQRNLLADLLPVQVDRATAMDGFLLAHLLEDLGRAGKILAQALDALVLLLQRNFQSKDLLL